MTRTQIEVERKAARLKISNRYGQPARFYAPLNDPRFAHLSLRHQYDLANSEMDSDEFDREVAANTEAPPARWTERVVNPWSEAAQIDAMMQESD